MDCGDNCEANFNELLHWSYKSFEEFEVFKNNWCDKYFNAINIRHSESIELKFKFQSLQFLLY